MNNIFITVSQEGIDETLSSFAGGALGTSLVLTKVHWPTRWAPTSFPKRPEIFMGLPAVISPYL